MLKCSQAPPMSSTQNVILRLTIVLGMIVAVMAVLYLTPLPEPYFKSCDRPCHALDWPMICRIQLEINQNRSFLTINGEHSGPTIQVCQNDVVLIDVVNKIPGFAFTMHWRGQTNHEAPYMDGSSLITQCPIMGYNSFQYKFKAADSGTHSYHAFSDLDREKGIFGALVVRQPDNLNPALKYYEQDLQDHVVSIGESVNGVFVNNKQDEMFQVESNKRYRFRVIYSGNPSNCPVTLTIDNHPFRVIALDGNDITPLEADSLTLQKGERVDFILKTNKEPGRYRLKLASCKNAGNAAIIYDNDTGNTKEAENPQNREFTTELCQSKIGKVCVNDAKSSREIPENLKMDVETSLAFVFASKTSGEGSESIYSTNNITFTFPPSPLLTQYEEIPKDFLCYGPGGVPKTCQHQELCSCVHIQYIPLQSTTELLLLNPDPTELIFHLHGYAFYVVGWGKFDKRLHLDEIKSTFTRNFDNPVLKDTIRIPGNSGVAVRFQANNPGYWVLRDENSKGWTRGLDVVLQVGRGEDMASPPSGFPTCGNFRGPDFLLM